MLTTDIDILSTDTVSSKLLSGSESASFTFQSEQLLHCLNQHLQPDMTGYWHLQLDPSFQQDPAKIGETESWYLAVSQGRVIFLGQDCLTWESLLKVLDRYVPRLRQSKAKSLLQSLTKRLTADQRGRLSALLSVVEKMNVLKPDDVLRALWISVVADFDLRLSQRSGQATFTEDPELVVLSPIRGFEFRDILTESTNRRNQWITLHPHVPSMQSVPVLNAARIQRVALKPEHRQRVEQLTQGQSLADIAYDMGRDPLEIAKLFSNWVQAGVVSLMLREYRTKHYTIVAIDDSPAMQVMVRRSLPECRVFTTGNPAEGLSLIQRHQPDLIVLDLTMPDIDGLEVCRTIREKPQFAETPIIILTARDGLVDRLRGRLVGANTYLTKPFQAQDFKQAVFENLEVASEASDWL